MKKFAVKFLLVFFTVAILSFSGFILAAQAKNQQDLQTWNAIILEGPIKGKVRGYFDLQPRNGGGPNQLVVRPAIGYKFNDDFSIWQGYSWQPIVSPIFNDEQRLYQELLYKKSLKTSNSL